MTTSIPSLYTAKTVQEEKILNLDLSMIKMKIMDSEDGLGWTSLQCELAEHEYKKFLLLISKNPQAGIVPTKIMDKFWHFHILDTRKYYKDCNDLFGSLIHHFPYLGMRGEEDKLNLITAFAKTKELYQNTFGEVMDKEFAFCDSGGGNCVSQCNSDDK